MSRTHVPVRCPECHTRIDLPIIRTLIVGHVARIHVSRDLLDEHLVVHEAEHILEAL